MVGFNKIWLGLVLFIRAGKWVVSTDAAQSHAEGRVTGVSGYWQISSKHSHADYSRWWRNSLRVNTSYVFYYANETDRIAVEEIRKGMTTQFVKRDLHSDTFSSIHAVVKYSPNWTHPIHVPSVDLARMWIGKVSLVSDAARLNFFNTSWFAWLDAGLASYRDSAPPSQPWPNPVKLAELPTDKIIYTDSGSQEWHNFAGTAFMYHISIVDKVEREMRDAYERCAREENSWMCGTDQILFTRIKKDNTDLFHKIGVGYGNLVNNLF